MNDVHYLERTCSGSHQVSLKTKLLEKRVIYLDDTINRESVNLTIQQIALLSAEDPKEPITILINSPGGNILDGLVLIDVLQAYEGVVRTVSLGIAASMAAVILAAGTKGHRYVSPHSQVMLHQPLLAGGVPAGSCSEVERLAQSLLGRKQELDDLLTKLTGKPKRKIRQLTGQDTYLNAANAVRYGLVDAVAEGKVLNELIGGANI